MKTRVKFLIDKPEEGEKDKTVFAFFPDENYTWNDSGTKVCYAHVGQHSACHEDYANECEEASPEQYKPLLNELRCQGYKNIEVLNQLQTV